MGIGYDEKTGIFHLCQSKARFWCRRPGATWRDPIQFSAKLLRDAGLEVLSVQGNHLTVKATPGRVWEILSGKPSDAKREARHL